MPKEILEITKDFMRDPARILVKKENLTLEGIRQYYVAIPDEKFKFNVLSDIYKNLGKRHPDDTYRNPASSDLLQFAQES